MITTFNEIIKKEGFDLLKKYEVDKWVGNHEHQEHITAIMMMGDNTVCVWYKDYYRGKRRILSEYDGINKTFTFEPEKCGVIWANDESEMEVDYKFLNEQKNAEKNHEINRCLSYLKQFCEVYTNLDYEQTTEINDKIRKDDEGYFSTLHDNSYSMFGYMDISEDVQCEISRIHKSHIVEFRDMKNYHQLTSINLKNANDIYECKYRGEKCLAINIGDKEYYISSSCNHDTYISLCVLYGYNFN